MRFTSTFDHPQRGMFSKLEPYIDFSLGVVAIWMPTLFVLGARSEPQRLRYIGIVKVIGAITAIVSIGRICFRLFVHD